MQPLHAEDANVLVLMATYNGAEYLADQIQSIQRQSVENWRLLIRDDGSTDDTLALAVQFARQDPRIEVVQDTLGNLGPVRNFGALMQLALQSDAPYIAFADQDDVWYPDKLERQLQRARTSEEDHGAHTPVLVHSDLALVAADLTPLGRTYMGYQHIRHADDPPLSTLVLQNNVVGCTMLANRALLELALPLPAAAYMHDWWLALCARTCGQMVYMSAPTVSYRQHGANQVGAGGFADAFNPLSRRWRRRLKKMNRLFVAAMGQAYCLKVRLQRAPVPEALTQRVDANVRELERLLRLLEMPAWQRALGLMQKGVNCQNRLLTLLAYLQMSWEPLVRRARQRIAGLTDCPSA